MIKKLFILILALSMSTQVHVNAADDQSSLGEVAQPPKKKSKMEAEVKQEVAHVPDMAALYRSDTAQIARVPEDTVSEIAIDMTSRYRKDLVVKLNLSMNDHLTDINFVLGFPALTSLDLTSCYNLKDNYHPVSQLTRLRTLDISGIGLTTTKYLKPLINLTSLNVTVANMECMKYIVELPSLKDLTLTGYAKGLDQLSQLTSLEKLNLRGTLNDYDDTPEYIAPSIDFLSKLTNLRMLNLAANHQLFYIKPIVKLPNLTDLDLSASSAIRDLRNLSELKSLVNLNLNYISTNRIKEELKSLKKLKNLRSLTISPLEGAPELPKEVVIHRDFIIYPS